MEVFSIRSFPRAIVHVDGDAFFASCEQAVNPSLKGKPVVTGKERGIASAVSYEAKARGVRRAMPIREILEICPDVIYLPSDYETYSLFSKRMFGIIRRYTPMVEEYGIDEAFAEITGLRRPLKMSYDAIALSIKLELERELGMTFSVGLAPTKVVAKLASKWKKPSGLTVISGRELHRYLGKTPAGAVWGIGPQTEALLGKHDITTALQFARKPEAWVREHLAKPHQEIWHELRGTSVLPVSAGEKHVHHSVSKTKTFTPPSGDRSFLLAQLSKNTENACIKLRRHGLRTRRVYVMLRTQSFRHAGFELELSHPTANPSDIVELLQRNLDSVFRKSERYRATGIVCSELTAADRNQPDLFGATVHLERRREVFDVVDALSERYGKHTVFLGSSFGAMHRAQHLGARGARTRRACERFRGEGAPRQRIGLPYLGEVL